jgi:hypothetical protein
VKDMPTSPADGGPRAVAFPHTHTISEPGSEPNRRATYRTIERASESQGTTVQSLCVRTLSFPEEQIRSYLLAWWAGGQVSDERQREHPGLPATTYIFLGKSGLFRPLPLIACSRRAGLGCRSGWLLSFPAKRRCRVMPERRLRRWSRGE